MREREREGERGVRKSIKSFFTFSDTPFYFTRQRKGKMVKKKKERKKKKSKLSE